MMPACPARRKPRAELRARVCRHVEPAIDSTQSTRSVRAGFAADQGDAMLTRLAFAAVFLATATAGALAAQANIGGVSVNLPPPGGFCELSESNDSDKRMITTLTGLLEKSGNKLLGMSADCKQLSDWHNGKRQLLDDYAQYQTPIASMDKPPSETVAETCKTLRDEGNKILANQMPDIKKRVESTLSKIKMNETSFLGVLREDADACYAGIIQKIHTEANTDKTQITVFAVSIVKNKSVFTYRFAVYRNAQTVDAVLGKTKADVTAMIAANR
jgi:hypothetical protein